MPTLISRAKEVLPACKVRITTNGLLLAPKKGRELLDAGLDVLIIVQYSSDVAFCQMLNNFLLDVAPEYPEKEIDLRIRNIREALYNRGGTSPNKNKLPTPMYLVVIHSIKSQ